MNHQIKIGIVEDELLIAEKIKHILVEIGYAVCEPVSDYDEAVEMLQTENLDLILLDINLMGKKDGIDVAKHINEVYQLPFIFLTANSDKATIDRAKVVRPYAYLIKPYTKDELFAAIEIAFNNFKVFRNTLEINEIPPPSRLSRDVPSVKDAVKDNLSKNTTYTFIRDQNRFIKILFETIVYIESMQNYVVIHTKDKQKSTIRSTFNEFLAQLPDDKFYRTHRSYAIYTDYIDNIEYTEVVVAGQKVPLSNSYRQGLFDLLGIRNTLGKL